MLNLVQEQIVHDFSSHAYIHTYIHTYIIIYTHIIMYLHLCRHYFFGVFAEGMRADPCMCIGDRETERQRERDREWSFAIFAVRCYFLLKQGPVSSCPCGGVLHSFSESCLVFWSLLELSLAT